MWIAFFIYPYFVTKIFENRKKFSFLKILNDFKFVIVFSFVLAGLAVWISKDNVSPPLIILGFVLPFLFKFIRKLKG